jgi:hypothetical protein
MEELIESIVTDLATELSDDVDYSEDVLRKKVTSAANEVRRTRRYPADYSEEDVVEDLRKFYTNIRNVALYDYSQIGAEFQSYSGEGAIFRNFTDRNKLFYGVIPIAVCS